MAWWNSIKDLGHDIGSGLNNKYVKGIGTGALALTGVGLPAALAIGAGAGALGGALRPGGGLKGAITEGGQGALLGAGGSLAGTAGRAALGLGHSAMGSAAGSAAGKIAGGGATPGQDNTYGDFGGDPTQAGDTTSGGSGGGWNIPGLPQGATQALQGFLTGGGLGKVLPLGLGTAQAINAANLQKQSSDFANKAYDTVNQSYATRAPLRVAGQAGLLNPTPSTNVSGLANIAAQGNPFARKPLGVA